MKRRSHSSHENSTLMTNRSLLPTDLTPFEIGDNFDLKAGRTLSIDLVFKVLSQLLSAYWFMQNTQRQLKLIATLTQSKIVTSSDEHLSVRSSPYERSVR